MLKVKLKGLEALYPILNQDGFIGFIEGSKGRGKTDIFCLLAEICWLNGFRRNITTNIKTESYMIQEQITNMPDLNRWLLKPGRKLFGLDEAGKHARRLGFMSKKNQAIMEIAQLVRHFDCGVIFIAPAQRFIDSGILDSEVIDFVIKKVTKGFAKLWLQEEKRVIKLVNVPRTSITFNSKDIAEFTLEKKVDFQGLPLREQVALRYGECGSYDIVQDEFKLKPEQVRRFIREHCRISTTHDSQPTVRKESP